MPGGGNVNWKQWLWWGILALIIFLIVKSPAQSATVTRDIGSSLASAAASLGHYFNGL